MNSIKPDPLLNVSDVSPVSSLRAKAKELDAGVRRLLGIVIGGPRVPVPAGLTRRVEVAETVPRSLLKAEVEALPPAQNLIATGHLKVLYAQAAQIPWCLQEIGRLRELTFRAAGEGTGKTTDIDLFDAYYLHLFVWDAKSAKIVGGYRMGLADQIVGRFGKRGLYTQSLFSYGPRLLKTLNPAIELGRSFVREEYQRNFLPLMLLWRGIGRFVLRSPQYAVLFGPVSISNHYAAASRELMVEYLSANNVETHVARHVTPRRPFRVRRRSDWNEVEFSSLKGIEDLSRVIEGIESDSKGVPILLKQYLKLGGRLLGFSFDEAFSDVLDGLIMVDLRASDPRVLARYMGEEGTAEFLAYHGVVPGSPPGALAKRAQGSAR